MFTWGSPTRAGPRTGSPAPSTATRSAPTRTMVSAFPGTHSSSAAPGASGRAAAPPCPGRVAGHRQWVHSGRGAEPSCGEAAGLGLGFQPWGVFPAVRDPRKGWGGCPGLGWVCGHRARRRRQKEMGWWEFLWLFFGMEFCKLFSLIPTVGNGVGVLGAVTAWAV